MAFAACSASALSCDGEGGCAPSTGMDRTTESHEARRIERRRRTRTRDTPAKLAEPSRSCPVDTARSLVHSARGLLHLAARQRDPHTTRGFVMKDVTALILPEVRELLEAKDREGLQRSLADVHAADIADIIA